MHLIRFLALSALLASGCNAPNPKVQTQQDQPVTQSASTTPETVDPTLKSGDIIFQTSLSNQSQAIQLATHSQYSHCGILFKKGDRMVVYEAVEPIKLTNLNTWIKHGKGGHYVVKRLKNAAATLTADKLQHMEEIGKQYIGKHYDLYFEWSDDKIYCSELVWKIYQEGAGVSVGKKQQLKDFDLTSAEVKRLMKTRYGSNIPLEEPVISPGAIFESTALETVVEK